MKKTSGTPLIFVPGHRSKWGRKCDFSWKFRKFPKSFRIDPWSFLRSLNTSRASFWCIMRFRSHLYIEKTWNYDFCIFDIIFNLKRIFRTYFENVETYFYLHQTEHVENSQMVVSNLNNIEKNWVSRNDLCAGSEVKNGVENVIFHENFKNFQNHLELIPEASQGH